MQLPISETFSARRTPLASSPSDRVPETSAPSRSFLVRCAMKVQEENPDTVHLLLTVAGDNSNRFRLLSAAFVAAILGIATCIMSAFTDTELGIATIAMGMGFFKDAFETHQDPSDQSRSTSVSYTSQGNWRSDSNISNAQGTDE